MYWFAEVCCQYKYINNVFACFLDASKAFDRVNHSILFCLLLDRNLSPVIVRFLLSWYSSQSLNVRWNQHLSSHFRVSNGVRQGVVLSPILFTIYLDELLRRLSNSGIGCHLDYFYTGAFAYADDIVLLPSSPSALRHLLLICEQFCVEYGLSFNAAKTRLIRFS